MRGELIGELDEPLLAAILQGPIAFAITDPEGNVQVWSAGAARLYEARPSHVYELCEATDMAAMEHLLQDLRSGPVRRTIRQRRGDTGFDARVDVRAHSGLGLLWTIQDVTDAMEAQRALLRSLRRLRLLEEEAETMAQFAAHDVLSALKTIALLLELPGSAKDLRALVHEAGEVTAGTLDYLGLQDGTTCPLDVEGLVRQAAGQEPGLVVDVEAMPPLEGDPALMERIFREVLRNARAAGARRIRITATRGPRHGHIHIDNDGDPIDPAMAEAMFSPRVRGKASTGLGFGLAVARRAAALQHGHLTTELRPDGARFTVSVPL